MNVDSFSILPLKQLPFLSYKSALAIGIDEVLEGLTAIEMTAHTFKFYTSVSVISSSKIEGEQMEVDSYVQHKMQDIEYLPELTEKPNDLFNAYVFAQEHTLTIENFLEAHKLITAHLLPEKQRGACRLNEMLVLEHNTGRIQYEAAAAAVVKIEFEKLWHDINLLVSGELTTTEMFYYASLIHLVFVNIHPFNDGNGRAGRLLEKWFVAEQMGRKAWMIPSEKFYYEHVNEYYRNLAVQGMFYDQLDYTKAMPFIMMLPNAMDRNSKT